MGGIGEQVWPHWPAGAKGQRMADVKVSCSADELFLLLWAPNSPYVAKSQEVLGNKDYTETWWVASEQDLIAGNRGAQPKEALKPSEYRGLCRKNKCSSSGMGLKYINEEMQRCTKAGEGGPFEVDVIVHTTATYGDRFRPILKHRVVSIGEGKCNYTVDYTLVYIQNTNAFLKKAIERGASNGVTKNFQILIDILGTFKDVGGEVPAAEIPARPAAQDNNVAQAGPAEARQAVYVLPWWCPLLNVESVRLMERPASWLKNETGWGGAAIQRDAGSHTATALAAAALIVMLALLQHLLQAIHTSCRKSSGLAADVCATILSSIHLPSTLRQVLCGGALIFVANALVAAASARLAARSERQQGQARRTSSGRVIETGGDHPSSGIRYDGYSQSLESAAAKLAEGEGDLKKRGSGHSSAGMHRRKSHQIRQNLKTGLKSIIDHTRWPSKKDDRAEDGSVHSASPQPGGGSPPSITSVFVGSAASKEEDTDTAERIKPSGESSSRRSLQTAASDGSSLLFSDEEDSRSQAGGATSKRASAGGGFREYINPGSLLDKTETMFAQWSGVGKAPKAGPAQDIPAPPKTAKEGYEVQEEAGSMSSAMELANLSPRDPEETSGPIEEEIFENERYQPFRGWGHNWPGHFLPTDRVGHWSTAASLQIPNLDSASFDAVAPRLRKDWEWVEEGWQIDMRGLLENGVDEEGWTYAVDFSWIHWPPAPGSGRFRKVRDYVRRRRWFRNRTFAGIPLKESPTRHMTGTATPIPAASASAPSMTSLLTEALAQKSANQMPQEKHLPRKSTDKSQDKVEEAAQPPNVDPSKPVDTPSARQPSENLATASAPGTAAELGRLSANPAAQQSSDPQVSRSAGSATSEGLASEAQESLSRLSTASAPPPGAPKPAPADQPKAPPAAQKSGLGAARESARKGIADKMSSMLAAASNTLRPSSAKKERLDSDRPAIAYKPFLVRGSAPVEKSAFSGSRREARRSASEDLEKPGSSVPTAGPTDHFGSPAVKEASKCEAAEGPGESAGGISESVAVALARRQHSDVGHLKLGKCAAEHASQPQAVRSGLGSAASPSFPAPDTADTQSSLAAGDQPTTAAAPPPLATASATPGAASQGPVEQGETAAGSLAHTKVEGSTTAAASPVGGTEHFSLASSQRAEPAWHSAAFSGVAAQAETTDAPATHLEQKPGLAHYSTQAPHPQSTAVQLSADMQAAAKPPAITAVGPKDLMTAQAVEQKPASHCGTLIEPVQKLPEDHSSVQSVSGQAAKEAQPPTSEDPALESCQSGGDKPGAKPSRGAARSSPFARAASRDRPDEPDSLEEPSSSSAAAEDMMNRRLVQSGPSGREVSRGDSEDGMPKALSADEASQVIQEAREAAEQVQRELHALMMMPLGERLAMHKNGKRPQ